MHGFCVRLLPLSCRGLKRDAVGVQVLLCRRMGKQRIIAETGAGQHGVATVSRRQPPCSAVLLNAALATSICLLTLPIGVLLLNVL